MPSIPQMFNLAAADGEAEDLDLDGVESASQGVRSIQGHSTAAAAATSAPSWRCAVCGGPSLHGTVDGNWTCSDCGSLDYDRVNEQTWRRTSFGTWMFFSKGQAPPPPWLRATAPDPQSSPSDHLRLHPLWRRQPRKAEQRDADADDDGMDLQDLAETGVSKLSPRL